MWRIRNCWPCSSSSVSQPGASHYTDWAIPATEKCFFRHLKSGFNAKDGPLQFSRRHGCLSELHDVLPLECSHARLRMRPLIAHVNSYAYFRQINGSGIGEVLSDGSDCCRRLKRCSRYNHHGVCPGERRTMSPLSCCRLHVNWNDVPWNAATGLYLNLCHISMIVNAVCTHGSSTGGYILASHRRGPSTNYGDLMWCLWWAKWH
jgi:hypothetical protein